mgnify:CR=1 FL=1|tara:strand:+ start:484 stop:672 length:189 start_codon:yes stop_codon:yes gene_type:complete
MEYKVVGEFYRTIATMTLLTNIIYTYKQQTKLNIAGISLLTVGTALSFYSAYKNNNNKIRDD